MQLDSAAVMQLCGSSGTLLHHSWCAALRKASCQQALSAGDRERTLALHCGVEAFSSAAVVQLRAVQTLN